MRPLSSGSVSVVRPEARVAATRALRSPPGSRTTEDRLGTGVASGLSIAENSVLKSYRQRGISSALRLALGDDPRAARAT